MNTQSRSGREAKMIPPLERLPPSIEEQDADQYDCDMVTDPDLAVEIRVGAVVGQVGKFVQHSVRQKCTDRGEAQGQTAMPFPIEGFLNENASEDVGGGLHSFGRQARLSISKRVRSEERRV